MSKSTNTATCFCAKRRKHVDVLDKWHVDVLISSHSRRHGNVLPAPDRQPGRVPPGSASRTNTDRARKRQRPWAVCLKRRTPYATPKHYTTTTGREAGKENDMESKYNVKALLDMAQEYLNAENEYRVFCLTFKGGWVPSMKPEEYGEYCKKETASTCTAFALRSACEIVSADMNAVIAMAKAMNRYEKRERWQKVAFLGWRDEDNARRFLSEDGGEWAGYFRSTGRRCPWAA